MAALQPKLPTPQARPQPRAMMPATSATQAYGGGMSSGLPSSGMQRPPLGGTPMTPATPTMSVNPAGVMRTTGVQPNPTLGGPALIGNIEEIDLDAQTRARNLSDAGQMAQITGVGGGGAAPRGGGGGGGGGETPAPPPLSTEDIFGVLDRLKGETPPREERPTPPGRVAMPTPAAEAPSASMGFARAKDQSGRIGNAALRALKDQMTERGISGGSGVEGQLTSNILGDVARGQSEAAFQQQLEADRQAWDAKQMGYQGDITQRAQDLGLSSAGFQGGIQQRGQDMNQNNLLSMGPTILGLLAGRSRY